MKIEVLKANYENACTEYITAFCKKQSVDFSFWVSDEFGGVTCINQDFFFTFTDIVFDINSQQPKNKIFEWSDHNDRHLNYISYSAYCKGARQSNHSDFNF